ncbi:MAG: FtsX-like permease family protein [Firmicutes bacterium]|nr:FtsX-like permease family protein [Bacillota bacterium]
METAKAVYKTDDCLGKYILYRGKRLRIIGITESIRHWPDVDLDVPPPWPFIFITNSSMQLWGNIYVKIRSEVKEQLAHNSISSAFKSRYPNLTIEITNPLRRISNESSTKFFLLMLWTIGIFGVLVLLVGGLGIAGLTTLLMTLRQREMGIRMALGATLGKIITSFIVEMASIIIAGTSIGLFLAWAIAQLIHAGRYLTVGIVTKTVLLSSLFAIIIGLVSSMFPIWYGSRMNPVKALINK